MKAKPRRETANRVATETDKAMICGTHGETPATFVCRHVATGAACGFHANPPAPDDLWPDAWCDLCEEVFQAAGGSWNERNEKAPDIQVLCTHCYEQARARNSNVPERARVAGAKLTDDEAAELVHYAVHEAQALQDRADKKWHWRRMPRWDFDDKARTLTFSDPSAASIVADVRLIGSYSTTTNTFQWAWATFDDDAPEAKASSQLRAFGEVRGIAKLTEANFECDEVEGWEMTALAAHLLGADGVYRAPFDHLRWFMLLSNWRRSKVRN